MEREWERRWLEKEQLREAVMRQKMLEDERLRRAIEEKLRRAVEEERLRQSTWLPWRLLEVG